MHEPPEVIEIAPMQARQSARAFAFERSSRDELARSGDHLVESEVLLVLTRFGLRHAWQMPLMYLDFHRVARRARRTPGLLRAAFLIEGPRTCYSLSLWKDAMAVPLLSSYAPEHVEVARGSFGRIHYESGVGPELWSTKWRLVTVSNNLRWPGLDLASLVTAAT